MPKQKIITVIGPTATGKTALGIILANHFNGEIISADSREVYIGFDLGSGKASPAEQTAAPHHLLDIMAANIRYSAAQFQKDCYQKIAEITSRKKLPIIVGGTGFYVRSVTEGYNFNEVQIKTEYRELENLTTEQLTKKLTSLGGTINLSDAQNKRRLIRAIQVAECGGKKQPNKSQFDYLQLYLDFPKEALSQRILKRPDDRIEQGMIEEVKDLLANGATPQFMFDLGLEYRFTTQYLQGEFRSYDEYREKLFIATKQFAKRQRTWFNKDKNTIKLDMSCETSIKKAITEVQNFLSK